jgi:hypothetical protein
VIFRKSSISLYQQKMKCSRFYFKLLFFCSFVLIISIRVTAQNSKLDSLKKVFNAYSKTDITKVNLLISICIEARNEIDFKKQLGGPEQKKFFYQPFKELLTSISQYPVDEQKKLLEEAINNWMDSGEQIDDVLVMGIRWITAG